MTNRRMLLISLERKNYKLSKAVFFLVNCKPIQLQWTSNLDCKPLNYTNLDRYSCRSTSTCTHVSSVQAKHCIPTPNSSRMTWSWTLQHIGFLFIWMYESETIQLIYWKKTKVEMKNMKLLLYIWINSSHQGVFLWSSK